jgi:DNA-binding transcriptional ArsR family regulator
LEAPVTTATLPVSLLISLPLFWNRTDSKPSCVPDWAALAWFSRVDEVARRKIH